MAHSSISMAAQRTLFWLLLQTTPTIRGTTVSTTIAGGVPAVWVVPPVKRKDKVLFYLHGGGYCWGSIKSHLPFVSQLASAADCKALLVDYRLAPEHPFPAALDDALAAYRWLCETEPDSQIQIAGDSAGAGLSVCLMLSLKHAGTQPAAGFLLSPWADLDGQASGTSSADSGIPPFVAKRLRKTAEYYANGESLRDPRISPVYGNLSGLPPLLIHGGKKEFLAGDAIVLSDQASQQGVDVTFQQYEGGMHALHTFVHLSKQAREYLQRAAEFLQNPGNGSYPG